MAHTIRISDEDWLAAIEYGREQRIPVTPHRVLTEAVREFLAQAKQAKKKPQPVKKSA